MKVLVVDDSPRLLAMISALLDKEGYDVLSATGGREAIASYAEHKPEIICLDVMMGDISGFDVCREIRKADPEVCILMITSKSDETDVAVGMAAGANDYIAKPFDLADLSARVKVIARGRLSKYEPAFYAAGFDFGDVRVFPGQLRAERNGEEIDLNFRDVALLKLLFDRKGKIVPGEALKDYCWTGHPSGADKAVEWNISQLRKKIEVDAETPVLVKSAGTDGYIFS